MHTKSGSARTPRRCNSAAPSAVYGAFAAGATTRTPGGSRRATAPSIIPGRVPGTSTSAATSVNSPAGGLTGRP
ncbi:MAG TPA: hypothetical protein VFB06_36130 [Streptosporangiaceae bacterium]|nr:hypothetical protein [Streptosporangiaceae bacterium]